MTRWITVIVLLLLAGGWLVPDYFARMWKAGHYQFFPLVILAVGGLLYLRKDRLAAAATLSQSRYIYIGFGISLSMILLGHLLCSNLLALLGLIAAAWTLTYAAWGRGGLFVAAPVLCLLVFLIPLPLQLDQDLIVEMQFLASGLASQLLDGMDVVHFREGVVLVTEKSKFLTEEACSGIRSLFSSLFVVAATCLGFQVAWPRTVINLLQTVVWVLLGNAIRVAAVVLLADHVSAWFASGLGHELLGLAVFGFILFMVYSTDQAIAMALQWWMGIPFNPEMEMELARARGLEVVDTPVRQPKIEANGNVPVSAAIPKFLPTGRGFAIICAALIFVGLVGMRVAWVRGNMLGAQNLLPMPTLPELTEADMPETIAGWQRKKFEHVERDFGGLLAEHSYMWTYQKGNQQAIFSVDRPWGEWHNLYYCYRGLGWETIPKYFIESEGESIRHSELTLDRGVKKGFVLYCAVDRNGEEVAPLEVVDTSRLNRIPTSIPQQIALSLGLATKEKQATQSIDLPASTLQLYTDSGRYEEQQKQELRELYFEARKAYLKR